MSKRDLRSCCTRPWTPSLKAREDSHDLAISFDHLRRDVFARAILGEKFEKGRITEIFFEVCTVGEVLRVDFRNGQAVTAKMSRKCEKSGVLFAYAIENPDGGDFSGREADDFSARTAEFALQRLDVLHRRVKMPFEEFLKNVHEMIPTILLWRSTALVP